MGIGNHCNGYFSCDNEEHKYKEYTNKLIKNNTQNIAEDLRNIYNDTESTSRQEEIEYYNDLLKIIEEAFTENYNTSLLDIGQDEYIETERMTVTFTTIENQKNNIKNNMTSIYLGQCENLLRGHYNLSDNVTFYMKKIDIVQEEIKVPKIKFDIYCKLNGSNLEKLDLSPCDTSKIIFSVPAKLSTDIDKLNASSEYYNDKCYSAKSDKGTDIITKDRQKEFVESDITLCQENCDFTFYNDITERANCSCYYKESTDSFTNMNINKSKLYENFGDSRDKKEISNLGITSCNVLGSKENIKSNPGFFSLIIILVIFVIIFILFCSKGYNLLENKMNEVIYKKFKHRNKKKKKIKSLKVHSKKSKHERNHKKSKVRDEKYINMTNDTSGQIPLKGNTINNMIFNNQQNNITENSQNESFKKIKSYEFKLNPDTDYELNWLTYEEALLYDRRSKCEYYGSLIRSKQLFIFTFCSFNDYNSGIIKKFMLFLSFALHYTTNALFFDESNLHQIYEDEGKFNIAYQAPKIIFSAIISTFILRLILQFLVLTDKDILIVKNQPTQPMAINMKEQKLKYIKIKFTIFFVLNFILLGLFWYYLTCFNAVYKNTQVYLIENTFISFGFSLLYPFIINIFPTIIRMSTILSSNRNQSFCYKVSQIIQLI